MFRGVVVTLGEGSHLRDDQEDVALRQVELAVVPVTQAGRRLDDCIEHGLEPLRTRDRAKNLIHRLPLLTQAPVLPNEFLDVERFVPSHPADSTSNRSQRRSVGG